MSPPDTPRRSREYRGHLSNTDVWATFQLRPGDVVVSTPPKCGTTWTQAMVLMLIHGRPGMDRVLNDISTWLDCAFRDRAEKAALLDGQGHRRCIKSHTPLDGIAYDPAAIYLAIYRHPVDAHFSMRRHVDKLKPGALSDLVARFPADEAQAFQMFVDDGDRGLGTDDMTLQGYVCHYRSFRDWAHLPNVHLLHYADLSCDLAGEMRRVADLLGITHAPEVMDALVNGARFKTMQQNADKPPETKATTAFRPGTNFFDSGTSGKWQGRVSATLMARYRARLAELVTPEEARWLESGGDFPA
ncbi:MAG: sulfotransferase domain-containing protein [Pseudomonadota bacterium]